MKNNLQKQVIFTSILSLILLVFINPFDIFISVKIWMTLIFIFLILLVIFLALLWKTKPEDEREDEHIKFGSKVSFIAGAGVLTLGMVYQSLTKDFDIWLPATLLAVIVTRLIAIIYKDRVN